MPELTVDGTRYSLVRDERFTYGYRWYVEEPDESRPGHTRWKEVSPPPYTKLVRTILGRGD